MVHMESQMKSAVLALSLLALGGCATLERHPVLTAVGTALIAGSIAASLDQRQSGMSDRQIAPSRGPQVRP